MIAERSSSGLDANVAAALSYLIFFITGLVFLAIEKESRFVKFHALQSTITFGALWVIFIVFGQLTFFGVIIRLVLFPVTLVLWLLLMFKAYQGEMFKVPFAGDIAERNVR